MFAISAVGLCLAELPETLVWAFAAVTVGVAVMVEAAQVVVSGSRGAVVVGAAQPVAEVADGPDAAKTAEVVAAVAAAVEMAVFVYVASVVGRVKRLYCHLNLPWELL